jgi:hypothetical protein
MVSRYGPTKINAETGTIVWTKIITNAFSVATTGHYTYSEARSEMTSDILLSSTTGGMLIVFSTETGEFVKAKEYAKVAGATFSFIERL